jgi:hypothetical protein
VTTANSDDPTDCSYTSADDDSDSDMDTLYNINEPAAAAQRFGRLVAISGGSDLPPSTLKTPFYLVREFSLNPMKGQFMGKPKQLTGWRTSKYLPAFRDVADKNLKEKTTGASVADILKGQSKKSVFIRMGTGWTKKMELGEMNLTSANTLEPASVKLIEAHLTRLGLLSSARPKITEGVSSSATASSSIQQATASPKPGSASAKEPSLERKADWITWKQLQMIETTSQYRDCALNTYKIYSAAETIWNQLYCASSSGRGARRNH